MASKNISSGTIHEMPSDLRKTIISNEQVRERWEDLTPLARNEWICWTVSPKKAETRVQHVDRVAVDLLKGKRRPCCWAGCPHRSDRVVKIYTKGYKKILRVRFTCKIETSVYWNRRGDA